MIPPTSASDLLALFGNVVPQAQLEKGLAALKPVPDHSGMNFDREKQAGANVRLFLRALFPQALFLVRFAGHQNLNLQPLKIHWPLMAESPSQQTVAALLTPFVQPAANSSGSEGALGAFQHAFGAVFAVHLLPREPAASDRYWQANRRGKLLEGTIAPPPVRTPPAKPRM